MCIPITLNCYTLTYGIVEHVLMTWRRSRVSFINDLCIIVADPNTVIYLLLLGCMCDFLRIPFYSLYIRITMQLRIHIGGISDFLNTLRWLKIDDWIWCGLALIDYLGDCEVIELNPLKIVWKKSHPTAHTGIWGLKNTNEKSLQSWWSRWNEPLLKAHCAMLCSALQKATSMKQKIWQVCPKRGSFLEEFTL